MILAICLQLLRLQLLRLQLLRLQLLLVLVAPSARRPLRSGAGCWQDSADAPHAHPVTGRKCLFVNPGFTRSIEQLSAVESNALLAMFHAHTQRPEFQVRWHWEPNTIAMWDNCCTQHKVVADNLSALRKMERITLQGDAPA